MVTTTSSQISQQPQQAPRESHVTVIKVQEETIKETKGKENIHMQVLCKSYENSF